MQKDVDETDEKLKDLLLQLPNIPHQSVPDGKDENDVLPAVENATLNAGDEWASAEYRIDVAKTLVKRCLKEV